MRLEHIPLIIGAIVALIGLGFIADALMADSASPTTERRRRTRAERSRPGEAIVGIGTLCMAAALLGRDTWRYGTLAVLVGAGVILIGIILNRTFLKELLFFRGPARRADPSAVPSPHTARPAARAAKKAPAQPVPVIGRKTGGQAAVAPAPSAPSTAPRPAPAARPPLAAAATPATPMRAIEPVTPRPDAKPPIGKVERRKSPRGKK